VGCWGGVLWGGLLGVGCREGSGRGRNRAALMAACCGAHPCTWLGGGRSWVIGVSRPVGQWTAWCWSSQAGFTLCPQVLNFHNSWKSFKVPVEAKLPDRTRDKRLDTK